MYLFLYYKMNLRNEILDKILTPVQYGKQDYKVPFVFNLRNQSVGLFYYGTEHSQDPNNSKFSDIESSLKKFIESYSSSSVHVAVETSIPQEIFDRDDTIRKHKESGFLVFLAKKYGVDVFCPEPGEQIIPLLLLFSKATPIDIAVWILLNSLVYNFSFNKLFSIHHIQDATATIARFIPDVTYLLLCQHLKWAIGETLIPEREEELVLIIQKIKYD